MALPKSYDWRFSTRKGPQYRDFPRLENTRISRVGCTAKEADTFGVRLFYLKLPPAWLPPAFTAPYRKQQTGDGAHFYKVRAEPLSEQIQRVRGGAGARDLQLSSADLQVCL